MKLAMWSSYYHDIQPEDAVLELEKQLLVLCGKTEDEVLPRSM
jgi:hypothetical protein